MPCKDSSCKSNVATIECGLFVKFLVFFTWLLFLWALAKLVSADRYRQQLNGLNLSLLKSVRHNIKKPRQCSVNVESTPLGSANTCGIPIGLDATVCFHRWVMRWMTRTSKKPRRWENGSLNGFPLQKDLCLRFLVPFHKDCYSTWQAIYFVVFIAISIANVSACGIQDNYLIVEMIYRFEMICSRYQIRSCFLCSRKKRWRYLVLRLRWWIPIPLW